MSRVLGAWACAPAATPVASSEAKRMLLMMLLVLRAVIGLRR
jgi:hypothetical protein